MEESERRYFANLSLFIERAHPLLTVKPVKVIHSPSLNTDGVAWTKYKPNKIRQALKLI